MTIEKSGDRHDLPRCGARKRQGEGTCAQPAGWGTDHVGEGSCKLHGGATRRQASGAARVLARREAEDAVLRLGFEAVTDPYGALQQLAGELSAVKDWLRGQVERLESMRYQGGSGEQIRGELSAYQAALRDTAAVLTAMARLRIDERQVRLAEAQGQLVAQAVRAILADLDLTAEQEARVPVVVPRHLRALAASDARRGEVGA